MLSFSITGCYLSHVASGQIRLLRSTRPIVDWLTDPNTPTDLRSHLESVQRARRFAESLGLDVDEQYTSYVDWPGDRVVTIVVASRPGEVVPAGFWFPMLGRLPYKGFFDPARAEVEASRLLESGLDVCVAPVPAYSTLGWLDDPVTAPMLRRGEGQAIETVFHELVHATVYAKDHIDFNETAATFIGQEASIRFYRAEVGPEAAEARQAEVADERSLSRVLTSHRDRVASLYAETPPGPQRDAARSALDAAARAEIAALPLHGGAASGIAAQIPLNDACLALSGTYGAELDRYAEALDGLAGDLSAFIVRVRQAAETAEPTATLLAR